MPIIQPLIRVIQLRIQVIHLIQVPDIILTPELIRVILHLQDILLTAPLTPATVVMGDTAPMAAPLTAATAVMEDTAPIAVIVVMAVMEDTAPMAALLTPATVVMEDTTPMAAMEHMVNMGRLLPIIADMAPQVPMEVMGCPLWVAFMGGWALWVVMGYPLLVDFMQEVYTASAALMGYHL